MAVLLLLQAAIPPVPQLVSGRVLRPGTRSMVPVSGAWVVLHRVGPDRAGPLDSLRSDQRGRYRFEYVRSGSEDAVYFVSAMYGGIAYFTPPLTEPRIGGAAGEIAVFDTTSRRVPITVRGHHVVISAADARAFRSVVEVFELSNDTSVTRVAPNDAFESATWRTSILPSASDFRVTQGDIPPDAVKFEKGMVGVYAPLAPGIKQVSFSYSLPASVFPLRIPFRAHTDVYEVLIEDETGSVSGAGIKEVDPVSVESRNFRRFLAQNVSASAVAVVDLPPPAAGRAIDPRFMVALTLLIGGTMIFALARSLRRR
ncbi:MAG TPA: hypothetical protein VNO75_07330 [Gemmatimonadaceae bacterium]|nr:hypothetical protein [Gemmatimonadaceae bacterium]